MPTNAGPYSKPGGPNGEKRPRGGPGTWESFGTTKLGGKNKQGTKDRSARATANAVDAGKSGKDPIEYVGKVKKV